MVKGTTQSGFSFEIEDEVFDDYELLDALVRVDGGETTAIFEVIDRLLGKEQVKALKEHLRDRGRVSAVRVAGEVAEIFKSCEAGKNSRPSLT